MNVEQVESGTPQYDRFREVRRRLLGLDAWAAAALEFGPVKKRLTHFMAMEGGHCMGVADLYTPLYPSSTGQASISTLGVGGGAAEALRVAVRREARARGIGEIEVIVQPGQAAALKRSEFPAVAFGLGIRGK